MAVHSVKDVPTRLPDGFVLVGMLPRADARDTLLGGQSLASLPPGTVVGTSSIRRQAQVLHARPDLRIVPFRGNVQTRMRKLAEGLANVTMLAQCGLDRLGVTGVGHVLEPDEMLPAAAQGVIGAEIRADDARARRYLEAVNHAPTSIVVDCERSLLDALDGSCRTPIAGYATLHGDRLHLRALVVSPDGRSVWKVSREGMASDRLALGRDAGQELRRIADPRIFDGP
jgi:hydroxymethylbilane synthase